MDNDPYFDVGDDGDVEELDLLDDESDALLVAGDGDYDEFDELVVAGDEDDDDEDEEDDDEDEDDDEVGRFGFNFRRRGRRKTRRRGRPRGRRRRSRRSTVRLARRPLIRMSRPVARHVGRKRRRRGDKAISASTRSTGPIPAGQSKKVESVEVNTISWSLIC